jgi:diamine N-acetyltransferase
MISLRDITLENIEAIVSLSDSINDELVSPNDLSIVEWLLRDDAWLRAIYAEETPVGLVMVQDIPDWHSYHVWRLMVGKSFQKNGFGRDAMEQVIERYKRRPGAYMLTTFVAEKDGNAEGFYRKLGFERDGRQQMNQNGMTLEWADEPAENEWPSIPTGADFTLEPIRSGMLRTIKRIYLSLSEDKFDGGQSPWMMIACSELDKEKDKVKAICANGYPVGYAICSPGDMTIKSCFIAGPYNDKGIEDQLILGGKSLKGGFFINSTFS